LIILHHHPNHDTATDHSRHPPTNQPTPTGTNHPQNRASTIGLLDIYGFESFDFNDLEQFCINLANEKLQQHFNHHVFKEEQAAYEREGIDWSYIEFVDNQDVLDLIEGKMGLMDLIDETCRFPTASSRDLADKLLGGAVPAASGRFGRGKKSVTAFQVQHYAGGCLSILFWGGRRASLRQRKCVCGLRGAAAKNQPTPNVPQPNPNQHPTTDSQPNPQPHRPRHLPD
jgi:hypothetical protein